MDQDKHSEVEKYNSVMTNSQFTGSNVLNKLPLPSIEDIYDSQKTEFFTLDEKQPDTLKNNLPGHPGRVDHDQKKN